MRLILSLCLIFFAVAGAYFCVTVVSANQDPLVVERATEEEARQVQAAADTFERKMRETRDCQLPQGFVSERLHSTPDRRGKSFQSRPTGFSDSFDASFN